MVPVTGELYNLHYSQHFPVVWYHCGSIGDRGTVCFCALCTPCRSASEKSCGIAVGQCVQSEHHASDRQCGSGEFWIWHLLHHIHSISGLWAGELSGQFPDGGSDFMCLS